MIKCAQRYPRPLLLFWLLMLVSLLLIALPIHLRPAGSYRDDAHYVILAESLATGQGYRLINFPDAPVEDSFPPGWPLLLAPLVYLFPGNLPVLQLYVLAFWLGSLYLVYRLFATRLAQPYGLLITALVAVNPVWIDLAGLVMSEAAYLFCSLLTLVLFERWLASGSKRRFLRLVIVLLLALLTLLIRTVGIALLGGLVVYLLLKSHWRATLLVAGIVLLVVAPLAWFNVGRGGFALFSPTYGTHVDYVLTYAGDFLQFWQHLPEISYEEIASTLIPVFDLKFLAAIVPPFAIRLLSIAVVLLTLVGLVFSLRRLRADDLYVLLYLVIFYLWTVYIEKVQQRQLLPILPFLYFYLLLTIRWMVDRLAQITQRQLRPLSIAIAGLLLLVSSGRALYHGMEPARERWTSQLAGVAWVRDHTPPESVIMTAFPEFTYLHTRRQTVYSPGHEETDLAAYIEQQGAGYVVLRPAATTDDDDKRGLESFAATELLPYLLAEPQQYRRVYYDETRNIAVFQVLNQ